MSSLSISCSETLVGQPVVFYNYYDGSRATRPLYIGWWISSDATEKFNANYVGAGNFPTFYYKPNETGNFKQNDYIYDLNYNRYSLIADINDITPIPAAGWYYAPYTFSRDANQSLGVAFRVKDRIYLGGNVMRYTVEFARDAELAPYLMWFGTTGSVFPPTDICNPTLPRTQSVFYTNRQAYREGFSGKTLYKNAALTQVVTGQSYFGLYPNSGAGVGGGITLSEYKEVWNLSNGTLTSSTGYSCGW